MAEKTRTDKKWKRFEDLAAHIQRGLAPDSRVEQNLMIKGKRSGVDRQIDIAVWAEAGQFSLFVVIDCKDYKTKVDVKDVESFIGMVKDVGANKGAIVSAKGFTQAAKNLGEVSGIDLYTLLDVESEEWPSFVAIPFLIDDLSIKKVSYNVHLLTKLPISALDNLHDTDIYFADGTRRGPLKDLVSRIWNDGENISTEGEHYDIILSNEPIFLKTEIGLVQVEITANIVVERTLYFNKLPVESMQGFKDEINGGIVTRAITTSVIDTRQVEATWQKIDSRESLAVVPVMTMVQASYYPLEGED